MKSRKLLGQILHNDLLAVESDLTRITKREHKRCMKHIEKLHKLVRKYYENEKEN